MPVIAIDGPEKAGKSTVIKELVKCFNDMGMEAESLHWGPVRPDDREHSLYMQQQSQGSKIWIWDRAWPSEFVYGVLLQRKSHRMTDDPWLGEWLHGRAVQSGTARFILTGPHPSVLAARRDSTDLDVSPTVEQALFLEYGKRFGWKIIHNEHDSEGLSKTVSDIVITYLSNAGPRLNPLPLGWAGPIDASTVFVTAHEKKNLIPGGWLPFSGWLSSQIGRELGDRAFKAGWASTVCDPELLRKRKTVIACGTIAEHYIKEGVKTSTYIRIASPKVLFTQKSPEALRRLELTRNIIQALEI